MCKSIVEWVSWSEGVKWKKRGPVVDENWSIVECRNLEIAESDFVEYLRSYGERRRKCSGEVQNCKWQGFTKKYCVVQNMLGAAERKKM